MIAVWLLAALVTAPQSSNGLPMRPGGISLYGDHAKIGPKGQDLYLHIYVCPKDKLNSNGKALTRDDISGGTSIQKSPFYLEIFDEDRRPKRPLSSVRFVEDGNVNEVLVRWLRPKEKRGPVILMRFGVGDEGEWLIATYPRGPAHRPVLQNLSFGADQTYMAKPHFDGIDRHGNLMIWEEYAEGKKHEIRRYRWSGKRFSGLSHGSGF